MISMIFADRLNHKNPRSIQIIDSKRMLKDIKIENILFLDIETVPAFPDYKEVPDAIKKLWEVKARFVRREKENDGPAEVYRSAGIYAEFGKIVCISAGYLHGKEFRIKSFAGHTEKALLVDFAKLVIRYFNKKESRLCAHNGKEFDFPFIARRMLVHGLAIPPILDNAGKKPWEVNLLDTMELWKFGDYKNFTSLTLLASVFDIPTPKDDIDGSMVYKVYWEEKNLERISTYCQKDVLTVAQILLRMKGEALISPRQVVIA
jgi:predicted PolB exonuclease-like 3'-5' exonuclease